MPRILPASLLALSLALSAAAQTPTAPTVPARPPATPIIPTVVPPALTGPVDLHLRPRQGRRHRAHPRHPDHRHRRRLRPQHRPHHRQRRLLLHRTDKPFYFSIPLPEGNYRVTLALGGKEASVVTVRAEARRLMLEKLPIAAGKTITRPSTSTSASPSSPSPTAPPAASASRRARSATSTGTPSSPWSSTASTPASTPSPSSRSPAPRPSPSSTSPATPPWSIRTSSPGPPGARAAALLPPRHRHRQPRRVRRGLQLLRRRAALRQDHVPHQARRLLLRPVRPQRPEEQGLRLPQKYHEIMTDFVNQVRAKGATPVIVTAMNRDSFDADGHIKRHLRRLPRRPPAKSLPPPGAALIDLNAMSKTMFEAMGHGRQADHAFMQFAANTFPGRPRRSTTTPTSTTTARTNSPAASSTASARTSLASKNILDPSVPDFNPAQPDPFADFHLPYTPMQKAEDTTKIPQT